MDRQNLAALLEGPGYAEIACRQALLDGARFVVWDGSGRADLMVEAYERKQASALAAGTSTLGFAEALAALRSAGAQRLRLGNITLAVPPYRFTVFLAMDPEAVVACLGIEGRDDRP